MTKLNEACVAILATDGYQQDELLSPRDALEEAGASIDIIAPQAGEICGWLDGDWADAVAVDKTSQEANPEDYDALVLPGGVLNPDQLRMNEAALAFIQHYVDSGKVIAAICHGPWPLINVDAVRGRTLTSYPSIRKDLENAGANWVDQEVVVDKGLVTSRKPDDLPAFNAKLIEEIREGIHRRAAESQ